jgi:hypothetical protein
MIKKIINTKAIIKPKIQKKMIKEMIIKKSRLVATIKIRIQVYKII